MRRKRDPNSARAALYRENLALKTEGKKRCSDCNEIKPFSEFYKSKDRHGSRCKKCIAIADHKNYREKHPVVLRVTAKKGEGKKRIKSTTPSSILRRENAILLDEGKRRCGCCREIKPLTDFHTKSKDRDGYQSWCKPCANAAMRKRNRKNTPRANRKRENAVLVNEGMKRCGACEEIKPLSEFYKHSKNSYHSATCAPCALAKSSARKRKKFFNTRSNLLRYRRGNQDEAQLHASAQQLWSLWKSQRGRCAHSGRRLNQDNAELGHKIAVTRGGSNTIENLYWLHSDVNQAQRALSEHEFIDLCAEVAGWAKVMGLTA